MDDVAGDNPARLGSADSVASALRRGRNHLTEAGSSSPGLDAEVLLRHVLGVDRTTLFANRQLTLSNEEAIAFQRLLAARAKGAPVAYLTGVREFMGHSFIVRPDVLIPRPETEILVEWALAWLAERPTTTVIDVGTGSGAIALSLAAHLGSGWAGRVIASDVSAEALAVAAANRAALGLADRVELVQGSLLVWLTETVDLILANLPYLRPDQITENPDLAAEPRLALDGGEGGLRFIAALLRDTPRVLAEGGAIGLEIDPGQAAAVTVLAQTAFPDATIAVLRDLAGLDRHVIIQLPSRGVTAAACATMRGRMRRGFSARSGSRGNATA